LQEVLCLLGEEVPYLQGRERHEGQLLQELRRAARRFEKGRLLALQLAGQSRLACLPELRGETDLVVII